MKLRKTGEALHIRTAYPMSSPPPGGQSKCQIYGAGGTSLDQDLPVRGALAVAGEASEKIRRRSASLRS